MSATSKPAYPQSGQTSYLWYPSTLSAAAQASTTKMSNGWTGTSEKPLRDHVNGLFKYVTALTQHINEFGVPHWDTATEYAQYSWARSTVDNLVYVRTDTAGSNDGEPSATPAKWQVLSDYFAPAATTSLAGISELATDAEAQALSDAVRTITPSTLKNAFKGANQTLSTTGEQKLPGGLVMKWGAVSVTSAGSGTTGEASVSFATTFPTACVNVQVTQVQSSGARSEYVGGPYVRNVSTSGFITGIDSHGSAGELTTTVYWLAIGY